MTVPMIKSIGDVPYPIDTHSDAFSPLLTAGAALGIAGDTTDSAAWLQRVSTSDGPTTIRSIHGNTIVHDGELLPVNMTGIETEDANGDPLQTRTIDVATYFPDGMRSAGTVYDELTETQAITRIGELNLGQFTWNKVQNGSSGHYRFYTGTDTGIEHAASNASPANVVCAAYDTVAAGYIGNNTVGIAVNTEGRIIFYDPAFEAMTTAEFKTAITGTMLNYALAAPTTVEIDPPLNMTYRTAQGGTERVMVPTGELSAPPTIVTAQGYTAESLRDAALATIAPVENGTASTNYAMGSYLVHGGQLCKVTTAIATGEAIAIGTNVTATTVMAEILSLVQ